MIVRRFYAKGVDKHLYSLSQAWLRVAAADTALDIVNGYAGQPTRLTYVDNWYTVPRPEVTAARRVAALAPRPRGRHIVKMFIYFSDVDEEAGPSSTSATAPRAASTATLFPRGGEGHRYPSADELEAAVDPDDPAHMTGSAGDGHLLRHRRLSPRRLRPDEAADPDDLDLPAREARKGKRRFAVDFEGRESSLSEQAARTRGLAQLGRAVAERRKEIAE